MTTSERLKAIDELIEHAKEWDALRALREEVAILHDLIKEKA